MAGIAVQAVTYLLLEEPDTGYLEVNPSGVRATQLLTVRGGPPFAFLECFVNREGHLSGNPICRACYGTTLPDRVEHYARIPGTHRQILCHVSWHLKQMRGTMLTRILCDCAYADRALTIA